MAKFKWSMESMKYMIKVFRYKYFPWIILFPIGIIIVILSSWNRYCGTKEIYINEICADNYLAVSDKDGKYDDYIELYNPSDEVKFLKDYYLVKNSDIKSRYSLKGKAILGKDYLLLYLNNNQHNIRNVVPFEIANGDIISITEENGKIIDSVKIPEMGYDVSYARVQDGGDVWEIETTTPGKTNVGATIVPDKIPLPSFSLESGFYEKGTMLEIESLENALDEIDIFYTTDGSEPSASNGTLYENPIDLTELSERPNLYSANADISVGFYEDIVRQKGQTSPGYQTPLEPVDKCVVIRAIALKEDKTACSEIVSKSYFIGYDEKIEYDQMPVVSLVSDPVNLFDEENGIYVTGKRFLNRDLNDWREWYSWEFVDANYQESGRASERPFQIDYFNGQKELEWQQSVGVRIKGNMSRGCAQKSFRISAREELDGNKNLLFSPFDEKNLKEMVLSACGQDVDSHIKDVLISNLVKNRDIVTLDYIPCAVFLDGEYWGIYYLTQELESSYISEKYKVEKDNILMIKNFSVKVGEENEIEEWNEFVDWVNSTDFSEEENVATLYEKIDVQSFIDYYCTQVFISRTGDWPASNYAIWKSRDINNSEYEDGRWRWILFDLNSDDGSLYDVEFDGIDFVIYWDKIFLSLIRIPEIKKQFTLTMMDMMNTCFEEEYVDEMIDRYQSGIEKQVLKTYERYWGDNKSISTYDASVEGIRDFMMNRKSYILEDMKNELPLYGELTNIEIASNHPCMLQINTAAVELSEDGWNGEYFMDYPITLSILPQEGYEFERWEGDINCSQNMISITPGEVANMYAVLRKK